MQQPSLFVQDNSAVSLLYQQYAPVILVYVRRLVPSWEDAEDIVLEVFLTALEQEKLLAKLSDPARKAWLRRVAHNYETHLIGPFQTLGTYHLLDEVHEHMNLIIYVQLSGTPGAVTPTPVENAVRVYLESQTFRPGTITIHKGMSLLLVNDIPYVMHVIMNGYWRGNQLIYVFTRGKPVPAQILLSLQDNPNAKLEYINGQGVPKVDIVVQPGNSEVVVGPFTTAGSYSFFDPVHVGMNLTVVVQ